MPDKEQGSGRILLVDDEAAILRTFRYCLEDAGYEVAGANSAAQAEALLQQQVFDLCFLDLRLGEQSHLFFERDQAFQSHQTLLNDCTAGAI